MPGVEPIIGPRVVQDRPDELRAMLQDMKQAEAVFRPSNYWDHYQRQSYQYIATRGIGHFRASANSIWSAFGAVADPLLGQFPPRGAKTPAAGPQNAGERRTDWNGALRAAARRVPGLTHIWRAWHRPRLVDVFRNKYETHLRMLLELSYQYCYLIDDRRRITTVEDSGLGSPNIAFEVNGKTYTLQFLRSFLQYLYLEDFIDFSSVRGIIEIGGGYGALAEVILQRYPHIRYVDVDIPPQSYIAQQYLAACFPGRVCGYGSAQAHVADVGEPAPPGVAETIFVLCPWQLPLVKGRYDLFINSASFQEMEPEIVASYAQHLTRLVDRFGYIRAMPQGASRADALGASGAEPRVLSPVTADHYRQYFRDFELVDQRQAPVLPALPGTFDLYRDMFFRRTE